MDDGVQVTVTVPGNTTPQEFAQESDPGSALKAQTPAPQVK
jgi:hypothetical protein